LNKKEFQTQQKKKKKKENIDHTNRHGMTASLNKKKTNLFKKNKNKNKYLLRRMEELNHPFKK
jgi:hypothetical protein